VGEYHFDVRRQYVFEIHGLTADNSRVRRTRQNDAEVQHGFSEHAKPRRESEVIKWNKTISVQTVCPKMDDGSRNTWKITFRSCAQSTLQHHIDYFFDIYDAEEKRMGDVSVRGGLSIPKVDAIQPQAEPRVGRETRPTCSRCRLGEGADKSAAGGIILRIGRAAPRGCSPYRSGVLNDGAIVRYEIGHRRRAADCVDR